MNRRTMLSLSSSTAFAAIAVAGLYGTAEGVPDPPCPCRDAVILGHAIPRHPYRRGVA